VSKIVPKVILQTMLTKKLYALSVTPLVKLVITPKVISVLHVIQDII